MDEIRIDAQGLCKRFMRKGRDSYLEFDAVKPLDFQICAGELVVLKGRSGSGKSTLLNMLAGLLEPTEGSVLLDGRNLYALDDAALSRLRNECVGVIPQGQTALHSLSVMQNVTLPYLMYRSDDGVEKRASKLLDTLGILELAECLPAELSGGEMRRMAVARALVCEPKVIMADEPTGDLDDENTEVVLSTLRSAADNGAAVLLVTHEQAADAYADRLLRMDAGVVMETV